MYDNYFSNFGRLPVPDGICKDSATSHPQFWRLRFLNVFFPYKCIRKQTWPCRKKVKCQCMTIILATLVDRPRWLMQRFSPKASSVLEKKIFKGFYHIWAWRPSWSTNRDRFSNLLFPLSKEAPYEIWAKLAQRLQRRSCLNFWTFFPYKCVRSKIDLTVKRSNVNVRPLF